MAFGKERYIKKLPHPIAGFAVTAVYFFAGIPLGFIVRAIITPDAGLGSFLNFGMFPLSFIVGLNLWWGIVGLKELWKEFQWLFRPSKRRELELDDPPGSTELGYKIPAGAGWLIVTSVVFAGIAGLINGFFSETATALGAGLGYAIFGLCYGFVNWQLAIHGYHQPH